MDSPRVQNNTELVAEPFLLMAKDGERLVVIVKATFERLPGGGLELSPRRSQRPVRGADVPWGEPDKSSIKYPSDLCIMKPGTDVIVVAAAHAPGGKATPHFDAGVRVGPLEKLVRVFGVRAWGSGGSTLSSARPTTGIELRYDYAWGGLDASDPENPVEEARNPVGMGVAADRTSLTHKAAPLIEDPADLISSARTSPPPAGLGAIGRHWQPRRAFLGTYDAAWLAERAPLLPDDHDDRANLCASPGLSASPPLLGAEEVSLMNLTPGGGVVGFHLPGVMVSITAVIKGRPPQTLRPYLDTVLIDALHAPEPADVAVELVWRAAFKAPRRMKDAEIIIAEAAIGARGDGASGEGVRGEKRGEVRA